MWKGNWIFCYPTGKAVGEGNLKFSHTALQLREHSFTVEDQIQQHCHFYYCVFYFIGFYKFWEIVKIRSRHLGISLIGISFFFFKTNSMLFLSGAPAIVLSCFIFLMTMFHQVGISRRHLHFCHSEVFLNQHKMNYFKFSAFWKVFEMLL